LQPRLTGALNERSDALQLAPVTKFLPKYGLIEGELVYVQ